VLCVALTKYTQTASAGLSTVPVVPWEAPANIVTRGGPDKLPTLYQTFFNRSAILDGNRPFSNFEPHLRLIRKHVVDFLLVLIGLCLLGVTAEALRANIGSQSTTLLQRGPVDPKFQVEGVVPTNHFFSEN